MEKMMKTSETKTKRQGNFELLRIISMVMIVTLHYLKKGGLLSANEGSVVYYFAWTLEALCLISVNSYVFISGYFTKTKTFKLSDISSNCSFANIYCFSDFFDFGVLFFF